MLTFSKFRFPMAFEAIMAGPNPIRVLKADTSIVSGITRLMAERASAPMNCPITIASAVTVICMAADDNNEAHK